MTEYIEQRDAKRRGEEMLREMNNAATKIQVQRYYKISNIFLWINSYYLN